MYPDTAANVPATTAKEWFKCGRNVQPIMMSMINKQPKIANDLSNKNKHNEQQQQKHQQTIEPPTTIDRKLIVDSNYNLNIKSNMNGLNKHKDNDNKLHNTCDNNNSKKFAFLAQQTIPDYRPQTVSSLKELVMNEIESGIIYFIKKKYI